MYSGTKIGKYNGGTFTEQPFAGEQSSKNLLERVCTILFQARIFVHFDFRAEIQVHQEDFQIFFWPRWIHEKMQCEESLQRCESILSLLTVKAFRMTSNLSLCSDLI